MEAERPLPPLMRRPFPPPGAFYPTTMEAERARRHAAWRWRIRVILIAAMVFGMFFGDIDMRVWLTLWGACVVLQLVGVALLANRVVEPGGRWGWSVRGQLLMVSGMVLLFVNCFDLQLPLPFGVRVGMMAAGVVVMQFGGRIERQAATRFNCVW